MPAPAPAEQNRQIERRGNTMLAMVSVRGQPRLERTRCRYALLRTTGVLARYQVIGAAHPNRVRIHDPALNANELALGPQSGLDEIDALAP